jgi:hypothetical protein
VHAAVKTSTTARMTTTEERLSMNTSELRDNFSLLEEHR